MLTTAQPFSIESKRAGELTRVTVIGELDLATSPALKERLDALEPDTTRRVVLDLSGVTFMDSRGIAVLMHAAKKSETDGLEFRLSPVDGQVKRVLECTSLLERFKYSAV